MAKVTEQQEELRLNTESQRKIGDATRARGARDDAGYFLKNLG